MASGESAQKVWDLHSSLGGSNHANETLFKNLVKFLPEDIVNSFVDDFCRTNDMNPCDLEEPDSATDIIPLRQQLEEEDDESAEYCAPV
tara:strand:- start:475 stop:741 length:267 start_codon:yes stop_codon:yes gene_type:complete